MKLNKKGAIAPLANTKLAFSIRSLREQCQTVCRLWLHMLFAPLVTVETATVILYQNIMRDKRDLLGKALPIFS